MVKNCLLLGTKITLSDNTTKNIEDLTLEDEIITFKFNNIKHTQNKNYLLNNKFTNFSGVLSKSKIKNIWTNNINNYYTINNNLFVTGDHIIFVKRNNNYFWTEINKVELNDFFYTLKKEFEKIEHIDIINKNCKVFSIEVNNYFNYFANNYLIHNKGGGCGSCTGECDGSGGGGGGSGCVIS